jgi:hypothetical protein
VTTRPTTSSSRSWAAIASAACRVEGPHGFARGIANVERVVVETGLGQDEDRGRTERQGARAHGARVPERQRREPPSAPGRTAHVPAGLRYGAHAQEGGEQRQRAEEADEHADAGDETELGDSHEVGGNEGEEADRRRQRAEGDGAAHVASGLAERMGVRASLAEELAVADAQVDPEVDAQADEEHGKGDRDEVEVTDGDGGESSRVDQAHQKREECRQDEATRAQSQAENDSHQREGRDPRHGGLGANRLHLFVGESHVARDAYADAALGSERELARDPAHPEDGLLRGLQVVEVEHRLHQQEAPVRIAFDAAGRQDLGPGQVVGLAGHESVQAFGEVAEHRLKPAPAHVALAYRADTTRHHRRQAVQAPVARELGEIGLALGEAVGQIFELRRLEVEEGVLLEEVSAAGQVRFAEVSGLGLHSREQRRRRLTGALRCHGVDDDEHVLVLGGEGLVIAALGLLEGEVLGEELLRGPLDPEMARCVEDRPRGAEDHEGDHGDRAPSDEIHPACEGLPDPLLELRIHELRASRGGWGGPKFLEPCLRLAECSG